MTSIWRRLDVEAKVVDVLRSVRPASSPRLGNHPFLSAYQLALLIDTRYPEVRRELGDDVPIGGANSGSYNSLAQYLAKGLAAAIHANGDEYRIEGATLSRLHVGELSFTLPGGRRMRDTNAEAGFDISLFRLRDQTA